MSDTLTRAGEKVTIERRTPEGDVVDTVELDPAIFAVTPNVPLMHQVVTAQLAARRSGTHSTRTRAEVAGGGAKPYRQKGTGRARQGSIRAPHYAGGGVALGPKPRSYTQRTPRKMTRLALCSALSDRASEGRVCIVDSWTFEAPRTKDALAAISALGLAGNILVVLGEDSFAVERSFANLADVDLVAAAQLTAYDVLANDWVVFSTDTVPGGVTVVEGSKPPNAAAKRAPAASSASASSAGDTAPDADEPDATDSAVADERGEHAEDVAGASHWAAAAAREEQDEAAGESGGAEPVAESAEDDAGAADAGAAEAVSPAEDAPSSDATESAAEEDEEDSE
jgi:large subunit ribosomal protein L4